MGVHIMSNYIITDTLVGAETTTLVDNNTSLTTGLRLAYETPSVLPWVNYISESTNILGNQSQLDKDGSVFLNLKYGEVFQTSATNATFLNSFSLWFDVVHVASGDTWSAGDASENGTTVSLAGHLAVWSNGAIDTTQAIIDVGSVTITQGAGLEQATFNNINQNLDSSKQYFFYVTSNSNSADAVVMAMNLDTTTNSVGEGFAFADSTGKLFKDLTWSADGEYSIVNGATIENGSYDEVSLNTLGLMGQTQNAAFIAQLSDRLTITSPLVFDTEEGAVAPISTPNLFNLNLLNGAKDEAINATKSISNVHYVVDNGASSSSIPTGLTLNASTLTVDPTDLVFDHLAVGDTTVIVVSYDVTDDKGARLTQTETITIHGTNDAPVITTDVPNSNGTVVEAGNLDDGTITLGTPNTGGTLTATDVDNGATAAWSVNKTAGDYGTFSLNANTGVWAYTLDNNLANALAEGESKTETFTATVTDDKGAIASQSVDIMINGANDAPVITTDVPNSNGTVVEAGNLDDGTITLGTPNTGGTLTATDVDNGATAAWSVNKTAGDYGTFSLNANTGVWAYTLDNNLANALAEGESKTETFTATVTDDKGAIASQSVDITINGTNDSPTISGKNTGSVTEAAGTSRSSNDNHDSKNSNDDCSGTTGSSTSLLNIFGLLTPKETTGSTSNDDNHDSKNSNDDCSGTTGSSAGVPTATGILVSNDVDHGATAFWSVNTAKGVYGDFAIDQAGKWIYTLDNTSGGAADKLNSGDVKTETFMAKVTDDKGAWVTQPVTITVNGVSDSLTTIKQDDDGRTCSGGSKDHWNDKDIKWTGTKGDDSCKGGKGDDKLEGDTGKDKLEGCGGNDSLTGGKGSDEFVFHKGFGHDTILDFSKADGDVIDFFNDTKICSLAQLKSHAKIQGNDVKITCDDGSDIVIVGCHSLNDFTASTVHFCS